MKVRRISRPVLLAACFLICSCIVFIQHQRSAVRQAEHWVKELYTVNRQLDLTDWYEKEREDLYRERFGARISEDGVEALMQCGLPYIILFQENEALVERSHITEVSVTEISGQTETDSSNKCFEYEAIVEVTLEKGINVLAPVLEQSYSGQVELEKNGISGWKLSGFTIQLNGITERPAS